MKMMEVSAPGAPPASDFIPLIVPEICGNEWHYVKECLDTGWVSSVGSYVERFEEMVAERAGTRYAVATVNGTSALHVALLVAGVQPGDEVLVSTLTFIAPVNTIRYAGAWPIFIDAEPDCWQMDAAKVVEFLDDRCHWTGGALYNKSTGRRVSAVLPVHVLGQAVDLAPIIEAAKRYGLPVIEDATEGLGASYNGQSLGAVGDIGCFSFNGNKLITTGGGGMLVTNNEEHARRAKYLSTQAKDDPIEYIHGEIGYNYRLTNVLAAIGCAQMERLDTFVARKRAIAAGYKAALSKVTGLTPMRPCPKTESTYWMYTILIDPDRFGMDSRELMRRLNTQKIQCRPLWQPIHLSPAHALEGVVECPVAEQLAQQALSLPCSVGLSEPDQERVIAAIISQDRKR